MRLLLVALGACLLGCDSAPFEPPTLQKPSVRQWVTPELALELDGNGRFLTVPAEAEPFEIITQEYASELAEAFARMAGPSNADHFRRVIGAPVPFNQLRTVEIFLGQTPHEPFRPKTHTPQPFARSVHSTWPFSVTSRGSGSVSPCPL